MANDPRGSMSIEVVVEPIAKPGSHHYGRKQIQPSSAELRDFHGRAEGVLKYELLTFSDNDVAEIACGFAQAIEQRRYTCYACAIMPDHAHLLIRKQRDKAEQIIEHLQEASRKALIEANLRAPDHPVWGGPGWKVFQNSRKQMESTISTSVGIPKRSGNQFRSGTSWSPTMGGFRDDRPISVDLRNRKR